GDDVFRWVRNEAELVVNSLGQNHRDFVLELQSADADHSCELQVHDRGGRVVARARLKGRQKQHLRLPTNRHRVEVFRLRVCDATDRLPRAFRVWHSGGHRGRPSAIPARDFAGEGVRLGANWYPLEEYAGQRFRWINNDAQVSLGLFAAAGQGAFVL